MNDLQERYAKIRAHLNALIKAGYIDMYWTDSDSIQGKLFWFIKGDSRGFTTSEIESFLKGVNTIVWHNSAVK